MNLNETGSESFQLYDAEELEGREGIAAVGRIGPWDVRMWWPPGDHGGPRELRIIAAQGAEARDTGRGITTTTVRSIPLSQLAEAVRDFVNLMEDDGDLEEEELRPEDDRYLLSGALDVITQQVSANPNPGRKGRPEIFHVAVAMAYSHYAEAGYPNPVQILAEETDVGRRTASHWVQQARAHGMLAEATERQPGGALTEKALSAMKRMLPEQNGT